MRSRAGHAYIASQRAEGWIPVADDYDDGSYSGGNMERPALRRLMVDIEAGRVGVLLIYKIDRLTRSHRWLVMLESGEVKTLRELTVREGMDNNYVSRMINLTMLSPYVVAAILDDTLLDHITLLELAADPPLVWEDAARYAPCPICPFFSPVTSLPDTHLQKVKG